jgi:hypothetical protein
MFFSNEKPADLAGYMFRELLAKNRLLLRFSSPRWRQ